MNLKEEINAIYDDMVGIRRHMHMYPELSFQEENTKRYIYDQIKDLDLDITRDFGGNGIVARLHVSDDLPTVALRADFDALPIQDEKDVPYRSKKPGVMHACGHDGHTAMLIGAEKILTAHKDKLPVNVVFIHQHAEENLPGGAIGMVKAGVMEGVDAVFGLHLASHLPTGSIGYVRGFTQANADSFSIEVKGKGGHGAEPHRNNDAIVAAAHLIQQIQTITSRNVDPLKSAVISVGQFKGGSAFNVMPSAVHVNGTARTFEPDVRELVSRRLEEVCEGVGKSFDVEYDINFHYGYPSMKNDLDILDYSLEVVSRDVSFVGELIEREPKMGGEDFAYYAQEAPGAFLMLGTGNAELGTDYPHHHEMFDMDEEGLKAGVEMFVKFVMNFGKR
ncbi:amidohydrolase [Aliicoccus persicus]|uniref:Amidohydrolase n=1 Tax=Aliicoccus persicus TaxID=930138 RepID=A0A662Z3X4_9STAP|nr:amidohydrolase [Aliicoccus persicus]SEW06809.1 amidohydrolase [Aliicoccus persicus]